jgi:hypothetical protein
MNNVKKNNTLADLLNTVKIKQLYYKNIKNELLFNHIINNSLFSAIPFLNYLKYSKLNDFLVSHNDAKSKFTTQSIYIIHNNTRVNLMTYLFDFNYDIKYVIYGVSLESMDGEYRPNLTSYESYTTTENSLQYFTNIAYDYALKLSFFKDVSLNFNEKSTTLSNQHYKRALLVILSEFLKYIRGQLDSHANKTFMSFISHKKEQLYNIIYNIVEQDEDTNGSRNSVYDFISLFEHEMTKKGTSALPPYNSNRFQTKMVFYYRLVSKTIPNNKINSALREIAIAYNVSKLKLNNITNGLPILYKNFEIKNYEYNNKNIKDSLKKSEIINEMNLYDNLYKHYSDDITDFISSDTHIFNILDTLNDIKKQDFNVNHNIVIIMEYVGKTMGDFPYILQNFNKIGSITKDNAKTIQDKIMFILTGSGKINALMFNEYMHYIFQNEFDVMLFNLVYTLLALNKNMRVIHNDLHLNNITIQSMESGAGQYTISKEDSDKIINDNNIDMTIKKNRLKLTQDLNNIFKNVYSLSNKNKLNNTFLTNVLIYNLSIIDFSRAILCDEHDIFDMLGLINDIFPFIKKNKILYLKLTECIVDINNYFIIFKIMSGYDVYTSFKNLYDMFLEEKKFNITIPNNNIIKLISNIKNDTYKTMYKNLMSFLSNKNGKKEYYFTNEMILYKHFKKFLLKNFKKGDFLNVSGDLDYIFPDQETFINAYNNNKFITRHHYNINNDIIFNDVGEMLDGLYFKS